jgi:hypothetical protein
MADLVSLRFKFGIQKLGTLTNMFNLKLTSIKLGTQSICQICYNFIDFYTSFINIAIILQKLNN